MGSQQEGSGSLRETLEAGQRKRRRVLVGAVAAVAAVALVAVGGLIGYQLHGDGPAAASQGDGGDDGERISVKIAGSGESEFQDAIKEVAAEKGLDIEWVNFTRDWVLPNQALVNGEVDANAFQHDAFLAAFNVNNDEDITPVVSMEIGQMGIFSKEYASLDDFPDGSRIVIPDDPSNGGRALLVLQSAGLIDLSDDAGPYPRVDDIAVNKHNFEIVEIAALTVPAQFDDPSLAAAVIWPSSFKPSQGVTADDALFLDDALDDQTVPYVVNLATTSDDVENPAWGIFDEVLDDPRVAEALRRDSFGNTELVDIPAEKLQDTLKRFEKAAKDLS